MSYAIGLIGGIASGKSAAEKCFRAIGIEVIDTDQIARDLVAPGTPLLQHIATHFGPTILHASAELNRAALKALIFQDPQAKIWLETLLHPAIRLEAEARAKAATSPYCIIAIPLLKRREDYPFLQKIIMLDLPLDLQIQRLQQRDHIDLALAQKILAQQPSRAERLAIADEVIHNDQDLNHLNSEIKALDQRLRKK